MAKLSKLTSFLDRLDEADLHYTLQSVRESAVLVAVTLPGERWEVEFMADGDVEVEVFTSDGEVRGAEAIAELFERNPEA
jgi:hypothetical protein